MNIAQQQLPMPNIVSTDNNHDWIFIGQKSGNFGGNHYRCRKCGKGGGFYVSGNEIKGALKRAGDKIPCN